MPDIFGNDSFINTHYDSTKWIRVDLSTGWMYKYNSSSSAYDIALPIPTQITMDDELAAALTGKADASHEHPTHGNINFTGTVSVEGTEGLTGERTLGGYKITFKKGLLVGFQQV